MQALRNEGRTRHRNPVDYKMYNNFGAHTPEIQ